MVCPLALLLLTPINERLDLPVEVAFSDSDEAIVVDARVNGKPVRLLFDTGFAGAVVLDSSINVGAATGSIKLQDFVGQFDAPVVPLRSLKLGKKEIPVNDSVIVQQDEERMSTAYGQHIDGILGFEAIKGFVTEINFEKSAFIFHSRSVDISKRIPDNSKTYLNKMLPIGNNAIELEAIPPSGKRMTLALDTGNAFFATTHRDVLERVQVWPEGREPKFVTYSGVASGAVNSWYLRMPPTKVFGVPVATSVWNVIDRPSSSAEGDGTVGFGFLKSFNITIDFERRRVWLDRFNNRDFEEPGDVGIVGGLEQRSRKTVVAFVMPGSPAAEAAVKKNDEILSIDDVDLSGVGFRKLRKMLQGKPGTTVHLAISHNGVLRRLEFERKVLANNL